MRRLAGWLRGLGLHVPERREWRWVIGVALFALVVAASPSVVSKVLAHPHHTTGFMYWYNNDRPSYLDPLWQANDGHVLFVNNLTPEPNERVILRPLLVVLGWAGRLLHAHPLLTWDVARVAFAGAIVPLLYLVAAQVLTTRHARRLGTALVLTSGGLGFAWIIASGATSLSTPADALEIESNTFQAVLNNPLFTYSLALLLVVALVLFWIPKRPRVAAAIGAAAAFLLVQDHPYDAPILALLCVIALATALISRRDVRGTFIRVGGIALGTALAVAITSWSLSQSEVLRSWNLQNHLPQPPWSAWLLGYAPLLVLGAVAVVREHSRNVRTLAAWSLGQLALVLVPVFFFARRLAEGLHVPLALLAALALVGAVRSKAVRWGIVALLTFTSVTTLIFTFAVYAQGFSRDHVRQAEASYYLVYPDTYAVEADELRRMSTENDVVLSSFANGGLITSLTGRRVVAAHIVATADVDQKRADVLAYFGGQLSLDEMQRKYGVTRIWFSREERQIPGAAEVEQRLSSNGAVMYSNQDVAVYRLPALPTDAVVR